MNVVDSRVVQLLFDGAQFAKGVSDSQKSLNTLDKQLNGFGGSVSPASIAVQELAEKFNHLGIVGITAIQNITNRITDSLVNAVKSVSIDQVAAGFQKYEDKITSVQTIMSATEQTWKKDANGIIAANDLIAAGFDDGLISPLRKMYETVGSTGKITRQQLKELGISAEQWAQASTIMGNASEYSGSQMEYVNSQLERLNWFTDETSYSFTDMTSNIGKFTAQGVELSTATRAMEGIATWAAKSGQNAQAASRAMYNMSQALGVGSVKLMDWKSIENANMATAEFKQVAMDTAVALGTLTKKGEKYYVTGKNMEVTTQNFSQTLNTAWFSSDVLIKTLDKYGGFADEIGKVTDAFSDQGITTTDLLQGLEALENGVDSSEYIDWLKDVKLSAEEITPYLEKLSSEEYEIGRKAFKAAQEAKTFSDAMDALKDGVSTAWMNLFETVFGNYEEAKKIWTELANSGYTIFAEPVNLLNELLEKIGAGEWIGKAIGWVTNLANAVDDFLDDHGEDVLNAGFWIFQYIKTTIKSFVDFCKSIFNPIKEAFQNIFPAKNGYEIANAFAKIIGPVERLFRTFKANEETGDKLRRTFEGIFAIVDILKSAFEAAFKVVGELIPSFKGLGSGILDGTASLGDFLVAVKNSLKENNTFYNTFKKIANFISRVVKPVFEVATKVIKKLIDTFINLFSKKGEVDGFTTAAEVGFGKFTSVLETLASVFEKIKNAAKAVWDFIKGLYESVKEFIQGIDFSKINFGDILKTGIGAGAGIGIIAAFKSIKEFFDNGGLGQGIVDTLEKIGKKIGGILDSVKGALQGFTNDLNAKALLKIAAALLVLAIALAAFAYVSQIETLPEGILLMAAAFGMLMGALKIMDKIKSKVTVAATALLILSVAMLILAGAMAAFAAIAMMDSAWKGLGLFAATLTLVTAALFVMGKIGAKVILAAAALVALSVAMLILAAAIAAFAAVAMMPTFATGMAAFALTLILVVAALAVLGQVGAKVIIAAAALMILSVSMLILAGAIAAFAAVAMMDTFTTGLATFVGVLIVMVAALVVLGQVGVTVIVAAAALLVLSVAMVVLAGALAAFAAVAMMDTFGAGLATMILMLVLLTAALIALGAVGPIVIVGAAALLIASVALIALAGAVAICALVLPLLAAGLNALFGAITGLATAIVDLIFSIIDQAAEALVIIAESIALAVTALFDGIGEAIAALSGGIGEGIAAIGEGIGSAIEAVISSIGEGIGSGLEAIGKGIEKIGSSVSGVADGIGNIGDGIQRFSNGVKSLKGIAWVETAAGLATIISPLKDLSKIDITSVQTGVSGLASAFSSIVSSVSSMGQAGQNGVDALAAAINAGRPKITAAASSLSKAGALGAYQYSAWYNAGANSIAGFVKGLSDSITVIELTGTNLANKLIEAARLTLELNSPSKVFADIGSGVVEGLVKGVNGNSRDAVASVTDMTLASIGAASDILANAIDNDFSNPVIRPTLDLSNVAAGASQISSMFNRQSIGINGNNTNSDVDPVTGKSKYGTTYNYVQNNYSPKALNRIEIYRQTKNQINSSNLFSKV